MEDGWPTAGAFNIRPEDKGSLSVNWMEFFKHFHPVAIEQERREAVDQIRRVIQMTPTFAGKFAVLNVGLLKEAILTAGGHSPKVIHDPQDEKPAEGKRPKRPPDPSHTLIYGYEADDLHVARELLALLRPNDLYDGRI